MVYLTVYCGPTNERVLLPRCTLQPLATKVASVATTDVLTVEPCAAQPCDAVNACKQTVPAINAHNTDSTCLATALTSLAT